MDSVHSKWIITKGSDLNEIDYFCRLTGRLLR